MVVLPLERRQALGINNSLTARGGRSRCPQGERFSGRCDAGLPRRQPGPAKPAELAAKSLVSTYCPVG